MANVLLLETDRQLAKNIQAYFKRAGHQLACFSDPQTAVSAADKQRPDIIILNLFLAARSGLEFLYELRSYPEWQQIPAVVISWLDTNDQNAYQSSFRELGVVGFLPKHNLSPRGLLSQVEQTLQPTSI
jgi:DNA-binding response OmpR family regulator